MNDIDPQAGLADVLNRLPNHPAIKLVDLVAWNWRPARQQSAVAA
jgi:transposase